LSGDVLSIQGGDGSDAYVFVGEGIGTTTIIESPFATGTNELTLHDLNPNDVTVSFVPSSYFSAAALQITVKTTGAIINVPSDFVTQDADGNKIFGVGSLTFANGTVWNAVELSNAAWIRGTDNDDLIYNSEANDTIDPGKGDDFIKFGGGSDRIIYRAGDGSDILQINTLDPGSPTTLDMVDIDRDDVSLGRNGNHLQILIGSTGEKITISDQFVGHGITEIKFSNGQTLGTAEIVDQAVIAPVVGTEGDDYLYGTDAGEILDGGLGNDTLYGGAGSDTYTYRKGDGSDLILDYNSDYGDILDLTDLAQDDVRFTTNGSEMLVTVIPTGDVITLRDFSYMPESIDVFKFSDGSTLTRDQVLSIADKISGTSGDDVLVGTDGSDKFFGLDGNDTMSSAQGYDTYTGGRGDDIIRSGFGGDTYLWSKGDGNDRIEDFVADGPSDFLVLADVASSGVSLSRTSEGDLLVTVNETGEVITVAGQYASPTDTGIGVDYIQFSNGEYWWRDQIAEASAPVVEVNGTDDADTLRGSRYKEVFLAGAGDDWINGREGDDILVGGTGNDTLGGAAGNDIYRFARGDGQDTIVDGIDYWDGGNGGNDTIELGAGFTPDQVTVSQQSNGNDLLLDLGQGDSIYIGNAPLSDGGNTIEQVKFADGTVWTAADLFARSITPTAGDDNFRGTYSGETISGGAGNDWVSARGGNDVLIGGTGNDTLGGGAGDDSYRFARGDGQDTILEGIDYWDGGNGGTDTIELGAGFTPDQVTVSQQSNGHDLLLDFGQGDSIYIGNAPITDGGNTIEQVKFADGTVWNAANLFARSITPTTGDDNFRGTYGGETIAGGAGNDWINGRGGNDIIIGGTGNDTVGGGGGDDTYRFARGDGQDTILDGIDYWDGDNGGNDTIELGVGFTPGQVTVSQQSNGHDLLLDLGQGESIYIGNAPITDGGNTIEQVKFVDGTVWSAADLFARSVAPTAGDDNFRGTYGDETIAGGAGNDWINGRGGNDIIVGGTGNDTLGGGSGDDTYRFARGDGQDTILDGIDYWDGGNGGNDTIELGAGITPDQVIVSQQANGNDLLLDFGQGDSIYIGNAPISDGGNTIEQVMFADGTVWSASDLISQSTLSEARSSSSARTSDVASSQNAAVAYSAGDQVIADGESSAETEVRISGRPLKMRSYDEQAEPYGSVRRVQVAAAQLIEASATFGTRNGAFMTDVQNNKGIASIADMMALDQRNSFNERHEMA
jgi:Ca2+-binding RTX toxin-like protein